jgi:uncharacterized membrane protein YvbJ
MPFCIKCGKENPAGAKFCGNCGNPQDFIPAACENCGRAIEKGEKLCPACGTPIKGETPKSEPKPEPEKPNYTKKGKKIITGEPKPTQGEKVLVASTSQKNITKKKSRSAVGCFFRTLFILFSIVVISALLIFVINILFVENDETPAASSEKTEKSNDGLTGTNIPGIVDIEPGDVAHLPENRDKSTEQISARTFDEGKTLKKATESVEKAFANADTTQVKELLTETALKNYSGVFKQIQPYMQQYAGAFKKRKLVSSTPVYKVYEFTDDKGNNCSAEFVLQPEGEWKLVRF